MNNHFYRKHKNSNKHETIFFFAGISAQLKVVLDSMQSLTVFGEINKYFDIQIIEIEEQPFWNPDNQETKFNKRAHVLELTYPPTGMFEGMKEFRVYKTLCFMADYQNKRLNKLVHLRDIYEIKCKLSMLCTSTSTYGIPFNTVSTYSLLWVVSEDYSEEMLQAMSYHHTEYVMMNPALCCAPFYDIGRDDDDIYFIKLDIAIHIQENMIDNIESGTKLLMEDGFGWDKRIKNYIK